MVLQRRSNIARVGGPAHLLCVHRGFIDSSVLNCSNDNGTHRGGGLSIERRRAPPAASARCPRLKASTATHRTRSGALLSGDVGGATPDSPDVARQPSLWCGHQSQSPMIAVSKSAAAPLVRSGGSATRHLRSTASCFSVGGCCRHAALGSTSTPACWRRA